MIGWLIYSAVDVEKNKYYIQMYKDKFKEHFIEIKLVIVEELENMEQYVKCNKVDFAINRSRNHIMGELLEQKGVRVFNSSSVTRIANNKGITYEFLKDVVPFLAVKYGNEIIESKIENKGFEYPYVIKSCSGHGGSQVFLVNNSKEEEQAVKAMNGQEYVVQQCCSDLGRDVRVYIIGNKIIKAVLRTSTESFRSNYSLGGKVQEYTLNNEEKAMVERIVDKLSLDYAGIDFTFNNGKAVFNEIEDAVGARMLYQVSDIDIVEMYIKYILEQLSKEW